MLGKLKHAVMLALFVLLVSWGQGTGILLSSGRGPDEKESKTEKLFKMSLEELMNVKVSTAAKTPEKISEIPASVVLITREDIETYGYRTLGEILENIPGLYNIDDYTYGKNFGVRGFWSGVSNGNIIFMVNGIQQIMDVELKTPEGLISIPVEAIERIEVIRGPMSVIYGSGAFYGAINIFTDDVSNESVNLVSASYGTDETKKAFLRLSGKEGNLAYAVNASVYDTYGLDHSMADIVDSPETLQLYNLPENHRTGGRLENNEKYFDFSGTFKNFYVNTRLIENKKENMFGFPSFSRGNFSKLNSSLVALGYKSEFSSKFLFDINLSYLVSKEAIQVNQLSDDFYGVQQIESDTVNLDVNFFLTPTPELSINTGIDYRAVLNASNIYDLPSFDSPTLKNNHFFLADGSNIVTRAVFAQVNYSPAWWLKFVAGIRLEQTPEYDLGKRQAGTDADGQTVVTEIMGTYDHDSIELVPRFAAIVKASDRHVFKFMYGHAIKRPSFFQNTQNSLNPALTPLEPESIYTLELNYIGTFSSFFSINASIFRNTLEKLITRVTELDIYGNYFTYSGNAGKMVTNGLEITLKAEPVMDLRLELSGTFQETDDRNMPLEVAYSPGFLGYFKASYYTNSWVMGITGHYVGPMETFWDETRLALDGSPGDRLGQKVDGYLVVDANVRVEDMFTDGLFLNIRCSNLLNEEIRFPTFTNNYWATRGTIGIGRTFLLTLGYYF